MSFSKNPTSEETEDVVYDDGGTGLFDQCMKRFADFGWKISCDSFHSVWVENADGYSIGIAHGEVAHTSVKAALKKIESKMNDVAATDRGARIQAEWTARRRTITERIAQLPSTFSAADVEGVCPEVARQEIRHVLRELSDAGELKNSKRGKHETWERSGTLGKARRTVR